MPTSRTLMCVAGVALAMTAAVANAQGAAGDARRNYEQQIASCNSGALPAPAREACVRAAGSALDRSLGGTPSEVETTTSDGRAVVVTPEGMPVPNGSSDAVESRDGRSVIVPPSDGRLLR